MSITSAASTTAATTTTNSANSSTATNSALSLAGNFNTFLTLLTTQLKNQDPTNPVDSNQFTQQLVEFAGVQRQVQSNSLLQQLVNSSETNQAGGGVVIFCRRVAIQASGNHGAISRAGGKAQFGYTLAGTAATANVTITDSSGNTVFTGTGPTNSGSNLVTWDGTNSITGAAEPAGVYKISVKAADASGNAVTATPFITGTVTSASISNGTVELNIGALQVPESSVTSVTNLPGTSSTASSSSNTGS